MTDKTRKTFHILNILLFICAIGCLVCYDIYGGLRLKGTTSAWFAVLGLINVLCAWKTRLKPARFVILIELGLLFGLCADILLGIHFILGILFFASGHVLYLLAFCTLEKPRLRDLWIILPIAAVSMFLVVGTPFINVKDPVIEKMLLFYAVIIACMLGKGISNLTVSQTPFRWLVFLGCILFWFSDLVLAIDMFGAGSNVTWALCAYTYWPAQNILAYSMFHYICEQNGVYLFRR